MYYGELIRVSSSYAPVKGRLHTRYSPVRRSPFTEVNAAPRLACISLPLAFFLSQDQTLHSNIILNVFKTGCSWKKQKFFQVVCCHYIVQRTFSDDSEMRDYSLNKKASIEAPAKLDIIYKTTKK